MNPQTSSPIPGRARLYALAAVTVLFLGGCSYHGAAYINSEPAGAEVVNIDDDTVLGITPVKVWWREKNNEKKRINVRLQKEGFRDKVTSFWVTLRHPSKDSALDEPQFVEVQLDKTP